MASSKCEHTKTTQHVEITLSFFVVEVTTLAAYIEAIEAQGFYDLGELGIYVLGVELEVFAVALVQEFTELESHGFPLSLPPNLEAIDRLLAHVVLSNSPLQGNR
jgi:hypothetical protein